MGATTSPGEYSGDSVFAGSTSPALTQAVQAITTTAVTASANPSVPNQPVTFTASVTPSPGAGTPTGTVTFKDGATTLGTGVLRLNGPATPTISTLVLRSH